MVDILKDECLTTREMIQTIMDAVSDKLWSSDPDTIMQVAEIVGIEITGYSMEAGLFWKKTEDTD